MNTPTPTPTTTKPHPYDRVREFREMMGLPVNDQPIELSGLWKDTHYGFIEEEENERIAAKTEVDKVDALLDTIVFAVGALMHCGEWEGLKASQEAKDASEFVVDMIAEIIIAESYIKGHHNLEVEPLFNIVMDSNMSKACDSFHAAKKRQEEYEAQWREEGLYQYSCHIIERGKYFVLERRAKDEEVKILKGDKFQAPEPLLEAEIKRQRSEV